MANRNRGDSNLVQHFTKLLTSQNLSLYRQDFYNREETDCTMCNAVTPDDLPNTAAKADSDSVFFLVVHPRHTWALYAKHSKNSMPYSTCPARWEAVLKWACLCNLVNDILRYATHNTQVEYKNKACDPTCIFDSKGTSPMENSAPLKLSVRQTYIPLSTEPPTDQSQAFCRYTCIQGKRNYAGLALIVAFYYPLLEHSK
jgi:hypothetical protein